MLQLVDNTDVHFDTTYESIDYMPATMSGELNDPFFKKALRLQKRIPLQKRPTNLLSLLAIAPEL